MLGYYFAFALLMCAGIFFTKNRLIARLGISFFLMIQILLNIYAFFHLDKIDSLYFSFDKLGVLFLTILSIIAIPTVYHSFIYLREDKTKHFFHYLVALTGLMTALTGAYLATSLTVTWIFVEATTLAAAMLIYHDRTAAALEATWKYIFVCSIGIALAYMGILFFSSTVQATGEDEMGLNTLAKMVANTEPIYLKITFLFVLIGYSTKMESFPMHTVGIDANSVAPPPIGAFISTTVVNMGFLVIFKTYAILAAHPEVHIWMNNVLIFVGILSLFVASGYMLKARHNKRMLAYSSLENVGIVTIAMGLGSTGYFVAILHLILHSFTKSSLFFQIGQSFRVFGSYRVAESGNYLKLHPTGALVLILGLLCITAIPPSGMFITEFLLIKSLIFSGKWIILGLLVLFLCFVLYGMATRFFHLLYSKPVEEVVNFKPEKISFTESISQFVFLGIVVALCFYQPTFLTQYIQDALLPLTK